MTATSAAARPAVRIGNDEHDNWTCLCGNQAEADGFQACDLSGQFMEPDQAWDDLYVCCRCGRIIDGASRFVVGQRDFDSFPTRRHSTLLPYDQDEDLP